MIFEWYLDEYAYDVGDKFVYDIVDEFGNYVVNAMVGSSFCVTLQMMCHSL